MREIMNDNKKLEGKIRAVRKKVKRVADLTIKKTKAFPKFTWEKFNGKKFITGTILTSVAIVIELYVPIAKPVSGYLLNTGLTTMLIGGGHKLIKNKAWIKALINKVIKKK